MFKAAICDLKRKTSSALLMSLQIKIDFCCHIKNKILSLHDKYKYIVI